MASSPSAADSSDKTMPRDRSRRYFAQFAASCGVLVILFFFFIMLPSAGMLPPLRAYKTADQVADHYRRHETGLKGGISRISLMTFVGFFFPMYTAAAGGQMARIPGVPQTVLNAQLLGGCLGGLFLTLPAYFFAAAMYRIDRAPELIMLLNDLSWIFFAMPFASLLAQDFALSYAILLDRRPDPLYPRWLAYFTSGLRLPSWPALGTHCVHSGPVAWHGGLTFWTAGVGGGLQVCIIGFFTWRAAGRADLRPDWDESEERAFMSREEIEGLVSMMLEEKVAS